MRPSSPSSGKALAASETWAAELREDAAGGPAKGVGVVQLRSPFNLDATNSPAATEVSLSRPPAEARRHRSHAPARGGSPSPLSAPSRADVDASLVERDPRVALGGVPARPECGYCAPAVNAAITSPKVAIATRGSTTGMISTSI